MQELQTNLDRFGELWVSLFGEHSVTCYVHILICHSVASLRLHGNLGQFSNSGLESFHKVTKWMLNETNRWGGGPNVISHMSEDLLRNYYKLLVLDVESTGNEDVIQRFAHYKTKQQPVKCPCETGGMCVWGKDELGTNPFTAKRQRQVLALSLPGTSTPV